MSTFYSMVVSLLTTRSNKKREKKNPAYNLGPGVLNPSDPGRSPHLRDGTRRARDATRRRKQQWVGKGGLDSGRRDGGRRLAALLFRRRPPPRLPLAHPPPRLPRTPSPPLCPLPPPPPRATYPFSPPFPCAGGRRGAGRRRLLLRAHPQDRMHALVSDPVTPLQSCPCFAHGDLRACGCLTGVLFLDLGRLQAGEDRSLGLVLRGPQLAQQGKRGILFTHFKLSILFPLIVSGCSDCECCAR